MSSTDRRDFLKTTALGATTATVATALSVQRVQGANQRTRLALIGCGGRGTGIIRDFARLTNVDIGYV
ncbi:MAG: twin-arginine translocation signal domain-containing protein, partial [Pirellulaceae bacterium]|nr:twin-arginine translocation signal domain-containing protein [Pirellulaceae bacterium]